MGQRRKSGTQAAAKPKRTLPEIPDDVPHILHCHSTFSPGGKELRAVQMMNAFGRTLRHSVVSGMPDEMGARDLIAPHIAVDYPTKFPSLTGFPSPGRLVKIAEAMKPYDLILTYNWGAMDAVMAHSTFARNMGLPPLIHHEDGFNEDETHHLKRRRNWYRQAALRRASALVVPSRRLEQIALEKWHQPRALVTHIPNGIDTKAFAKRPDPNALRVLKREGEYWVGTLAGLREIKRLDQLVHVIGAMPENWHLVLIGEGPERETILQTAEALGLSYRVHLPGKVSNPAKVIGLLDIFALSSASEQFPLSVVEAMAAGLPIAAPDVGDIASMVAEPNRPFIAKAGDTEDLHRVVEALERDPDLRARVGEANKAKARAQFDQSAMIERYRTLYSKAMGREF